MNLLEKRNRFGRSYGFLPGILAATICCMAAKPAASDDDVTSQEEGGGGGTGTGTGVTVDPKVKTGVSNKTVEEAAVNTELLTLLKTYDEVKAQANSYMCDIAEHINKNNLGRPVVIKTLIEARGITLETAGPTASRLMKLAKSPELIQGLRDGSVTVRESLYGRPKPGTTTEAGGGAGGETAGGGKATGKSDTEKKEDKYNRLLKEFTDVAKASGFSLDEIMTSLRASLKDAGIK